MKIGTYISELLFDHEFVLLPGLGEFSTKYIPARFIPEEKKIESPKKIATFNGAKIKGESPLIGLLAERESKDTKQVIEFLGNFVREIKETLASGQKVKLDRLGVFGNDPDGNLVFKPDPEVNYLTESAGLGAISEPTRVVVPSVAAPVEEPEPEAPTESPKIEEEVPEKPKPDPVDEKPATFVVEPEEPTPETVRQDLPKAVKWLAWVIIPFLVVLIILAFNWNYLFGRKTKAPTPKAHTEATIPAFMAEPESQEAEADALSPDETPVTPKETAETLPSKPIAGQRTYFIVVGAFQDETQANRLVEQLRKKGATQAQIFMTTNTGYHRVCYAFFSSQEEAEAHLPEVQQNVSSEAWILQRN